jgi:hypothetical protein
MLDQSFSLKNFRTIFEIENRKGRFEKSFFSDEYLDLTGELNREKEKRDKLIAIESYDDNYKLTQLQIEELTKTREDLLDTEFLFCSKQVNGPGFGFVLNRFFDLDTANYVYSVNKDKTSFFTMKQLQYNIYRCFKVKQTDRHSIVKQVKTILQDNMPKYIVRTDIKKFYESVPQTKMFELLEGNQLLSPKSNELIKNIVHHFNDLSGQLALPKDQRIGLPRGAGISAYLSELYMRTIDSKINKLDNLIFYGRYVDDIIAIFIPQSEKTSSYYLDKIEEIVVSEGLNLNTTATPAKSYQIDAYESEAASAINFLGYVFKIENKRYKDIYLSTNKINKYKHRLEATFNSYLKDYGHNYLEARKLLIHRLNYLTKNTRLIRPKKGLVGIYYSNSLLEKNSTCLDKLNDVLYKLIDTKLPATTFPELNQRLKRFCFKKGFINKLFFNVDSKRKNVPDLRPKKLKLLKSSNNFERIVAAWK